MRETANNNSAWAIPNFLTVGANGHLLIDNVDALRLARDFDTPLFVFSETRIRHNIRRLKQAENALRMPLKICYAAKANSNMGVLRAVKDAGADIETNSGGELYKALKVGFRPDQIIFNGTSKTEREHEEAIAAGIYAIQADSFFEVEQIARVAAATGKRANVSLRLVPEIKTDTLHGLQTALRTSKFGMTSREFYECFRRFGDSTLVNLCGIHLHLGSQTPAAAPFAEAFKVLFTHLRGVFENHGKKLQHINLGGGFPVNYLRDDSNAFLMSDAQNQLFRADLEPTTAMQKAAEIVREAAKSLGQEHLLENMTILLEPGRSVIADAGIVLTTVRNQKFRPDDAGGDSWILTDAGFNILLSMETYKWYYHLISATRADAAAKTRYKVAGPLCDGGDVYFDIEGKNRLPEFRLLPENVQPGELLALLNAGAYSLAQMFPYNGRPLPAAVLIRENGEIEQIRKPDSYETLIESDVW